MTKGPRTIVALLAVVAALLGLNLLSDSPEAVAQVEEGAIIGACCFPDGSCTQGCSEVSCLANGGIFQGEGVNCVAVICQQPQPPRTLVSVAVDRVEGNHRYRIFRAWSNGDVDMTHAWWNELIGQECNLEFPPCTVDLIPPPCPADVNDDLSVNVLDLIDVLLAFGQACP